MTRTKPIHKVGTLHRAIHRENKVVNSLLAIAS